MARRRSKAEAQLIVWALIVGLPIYGLTQLGKSVGWDALTAGIVIAIILYLSFKAVKTKRRREALMTKYQDAALVEKLMKRSFWQGQTAEQLLDSLGPPEDTDEKILKTKKKETWKYHHQGGNRYSLRIILDDDVVVGWDQK